MKKIDPNRPVAYMGTIIVAILSAILSIVQAEKRILPMAAGILLLVLNFALTGVILLTIAQDTARRYSEIVVISIATYTFYKIIMAVVNMVKVRKMQSPVLITIRNIGVADALVSMLTLQATMLASFQGKGGLDANRMNAITGMVVCVLILALGVSMIRYAFKNQKDN